MHKFDEPHGTIKTYNVQYSHCSVYNKLTKHCKIMEKSDYLFADDILPILSPHTSCGHLLRWVFV